MKGVFNIMKTNKVQKLIIALAALVILSSLTVTAFAETGTDITSEVFSFKRGEKENRNTPQRHDADWFEDWFEKRIETRERDVDFSELPGRPTENEMVQFFEKHFMGENTPSQNGEKPARPMKKDPKADRFDDWFEDRVESREHVVDFSELPENPTDEEILEFFKKNFMSESNSETMKEPGTGKEGKPVSEQKNDPKQPIEPNAAPVPETKPAPDQPAEPNTAPAPDTGTAPEKPENLPMDEVPAEEGAKDRA